MDSAPGTSFLAICGRDLHTTSGCVKVFVYMRSRSHPRLLRILFLAHRFLAPQIMHLSNSMSGRDLHTTSGGEATHATPTHATFKLREWSRFTHRRQRRWKMSDSSSTRLSWTRGGPTHATFKLREWSRFTHHSRSPTTKRNPKTRPRNTHPRPDFK